MQSPRLIEKRGGDFEIIHRNLFADNSLKKLKIFVPITVNAKPMQDSWHGAKKLGSCFFPRGPAKRG
ncbi:MAG TPA: hypothetical protein VE988_27070 [Gemmataceae bacterium]|nr:hypothetical protein [Gemmataceae bacterium]